MIRTDAPAVPTVDTPGQESRRADLRRQVTRLFGWRYRTQPDATYPPVGELDSADLVEVPLSAVPAGYADDALYLLGEMVVSAVYNGADGDDWSQSNLGSRIALAHPMTPQRRAVIDALHAEYGVEHLAAAVGAGTDAARVLVTAGWTATRARTCLGGVSLRTAADAEAVLAHPHLWEPDSGWRVCTSLSRRRLTVAEAVDLHARGVSWTDAQRLAVAGIPPHRMHTAAPPAIDPAATMVVLRYPGLHGHGGTAVTGDPATARALLARRPDMWGKPPQVVAVGPRCVHTTGAAGGWSLWDDGTLVTRCHWIDPAERDAVPQLLPPGAVAALSLVAGSLRGSQVRSRAAWHPLRSALTHTAVSLRSEKDTHHGRGKELIRHTFNLPDGGHVHWWQVCTQRWGNGEDSDVQVCSQVWHAEAAARRTYERQWL